MFERFTDRARKVMALANQEAQRFNHEYIGTEHILLGLIKEGSGVGANVLKNLDVDLSKVRAEVEKLVESRPGTRPVGRLPQTPGAKHVIELAIQEARSLNHNYVGTEHLLLGLLREPEGVAAQVLVNLGLSLEQIRQELVNLLGDAREHDAQAPAPGKPASQEGFSFIYRSNWVVHLLTGFELQLERLRMARDQAVKASNFERARELEVRADAAQNSVEDVLREFDQLCQKAEKLLDDLRKEQGAD